MHKVSKMYWQYVARGEIADRSVSGMQHVVGVVENFGTR